MGESLRRQDSVKVVGVAHDLDGAIQAFADIDPHLVLLNRPRPQGSPAAKSIKQIDAKLGTEVATVRNQVHNILQKLWVSRRGEAAAKNAIPKLLGQRSVDVA